MSWKVQTDHPAALNREASREAVNVHPERQVPGMAMDNKPMEEHVYRKGEALIPSNITETCLVRDLRAFIGKELAKYVFTGAGTLRAEIAQDIHSLLIADATDNNRSDVIAILNQVNPV